MEKKLQSHMLPVTKLFSQDYFFRVPEYQRPFLWDREHFADLIDDLSSSAPGEPYFLGTLVLHEYQNSHYDIVDGQQRLTALCILLACLRDAPALAGDEGLIKELHEKIIQPARILDNISEKSRVTVKDPAVFNALIGTEGGTNAQFVTPGKGSPSERRYELARSIFREKIDRLSKDQIHSLATLVTQDCNLIFLATNSFEDAFRLFTVVNDRGKQLRRIDVLKARNLDPAAVPNEDTRSKYAHLWEGMEEQLGEKLFEEIFHLLRIIYLKEKPQADLHSEFNERILGKKGMPQRGAEFLDELQSYVDLYDAIFVAMDFVDTEEMIDPKYHTLMQAMVDHFPASEWKACMLHFGKKFGSEYAYDLLLKIEKVYLDHWVRGIRKDERYGIYTEILKGIAEAKSAEEVLNNIEVDLTEIKAACEVPNFYGAGYAKYLLVRAEIIASELDHKRHFQVRSIEHILPQNPAAESEWISIFTPKEREDLVNTAGNLVLLSKAKNSSAGRREFEAKKETYLKPRVSDFPRSMQILDYGTWNADIIKQRTEEFRNTVMNNI